MLIWEQYDDDTHGAEWLTDDGAQRLALVKRVRDDHYSIVAGTLNELEWSGESDTLSGGKAKAARFLLLVNNCEPKWLDKLKWLV
jgi:hypothetical protein